MRPTPDLDRHGTDPDWIRRQIARAEAQDAAALGRPTQHVRPETMERLYARRRDFALRALAWAAFAAAVVGVWAWVVM
jgi:hypothetical protein